MTDQPTERRRRRSASRQAGPPAAPPVPTPEVVEVPFEVAVLEESRTAAEPSGASEASKRRKNKNNKNKKKGSSSSSSSSAVALPVDRLGPPPKLPRGGLRVVALGGIGEIGRNMTVFEYDGQLLIVDCGVLFPEDAQPGVDLILPDFRYIEDRMDDVAAVILTHGHEDHIGAVPFLLRLRGDLIGLGSAYLQPLKESEFLSAIRRAALLLTLTLTPLASAGAPFQTPEAVSADRRGGASPGYNGEAIRRLDPE